MFSPSLISSILAKAQSRGLGGSIGRVPAGPSEPRTWPDASDPWGPRIASLIDSGSLSSSELNALAWDAIGREKGSWIDPFEMEVSPLGNLSDLGSRYRDLVRLGEGSTAQVFKALDTLLLRQVAIKVLKDPDGQALLEARAQAMVEHPNVCRVYEVGKGFLVMQLVDGPTLSRVAPSLAHEEKVRIVRDIAFGIHAAHIKGLVHLDLKLSNVLLDRDEEGRYHPIIGDFGMVRTDIPDAAKGCPMGTPPYTSPEQISGDMARIGRSSDVYSLGVMIYVLLAGKIPFVVDAFDDLLKAIAQDAPIPLHVRVPEVPRDLEAIVHRCLEKRPEDRYASAKDLGEDLDRFLRNEPVRAMGRTWLYAFRKCIRRNPKVQGTVAIGLVILMAMAGVQFRHNRFVLQQTEWDHYFQQLVEELRTTIDQAYRLPAHNIEPELRKVQDQIRAIESSRAKGGPAAQGPGLLALGQAHFILDPAANDVLGYLQAAWDSGYHVEGVRTWLALALVRRAQATPLAWLYTGQARTVLEEQEKEIPEACLNQARRMLKGREYPDQARLAHLVELAESQLRAPMDPDRPIQMARSFRARLPNDLDGMLEEADALARKADHLAHQAAGGTSVFPPAAPAEVERLRQEAWGILQRMQAAAPSDPAVYAASAKWWLRQEAFPTDRTPDPEVICTEAEAWLDRGRAIHADCMELISQETSLLCGPALYGRLRGKQDPTPLARKLQETFHHVTRSDLPGAALEVATAMAQFDLTCQIFRNPAESSLQEALQALSRHPPPGSFGTILDLGLQLGRIQIETGRDPEPTLRAVLSSAKPGNEIEQALVIQGDLFLAENVWIKGGDALPSLNDAESRLATLNPRLQIYRPLELCLRRVRAEIRDDAQAWERLAACVQEYQTSLPLDPLEPLLWDAQLALARHIKASGGSIGTLIEEIQRALCRPEVQAHYPDALLRVTAAQTRLLAADRAADPLALLLEGLSECDEALACPPLPGPFERMRHRTEFMCHPSLFPARLFKLKGELLLGVAKRAQTPGARIRARRRAREALAASLKCNPNLQRLLQPLLAEARTQEMTPGSPHART